MLFSTFNLLLLLAVLARTSASATNAASETEAEHNLRHISQAGPADERNLEEINQIFGGSAAVAGEFPDFVSLEVEPGVYACGGTLISADRVLTAAHCFFQSSGDLLFEGTDGYSGVRFGHIGTSDGETREIECVIIHPDFTDDSEVSVQLYSDLAILKLKSPFSTTNFATLNSNVDYPSIAGAPMTAVGFGVTMDGDSADQSSVLLKQTEGFVTAAACATSSNPAPQCISSRYHVCLSSNVGGACQGDSGGPIYDANKVQIGMTSFGPPCEAEGFDVYSNIAPFNAWIQAQMLSSAVCSPSSFALDKTFTGNCDAAGTTPAPTDATPTPCPLYQEARDFMSIAVSWLGFADDNERD